MAVTGGERAVASARSAPPTPRRDLPRRERKKRQTREALLRVALELFEAQGYEQTAVHEITDAVDVSERTFFRYFASKEDLVLSFVRDAAAALVEAVAARPAAEEPFTALRHALRQSLATLATGDGVLGDEPGYLSIVKLIDTTPTLIAANLRYAHEHCGELVAVLARREGVDPATDVRPRILADTFGALLFAANRDWRTGGVPGVDAMLATFDAYADQFGPGLFRHWATGPDEDATARH